MEAYALHLGTHIRKCKEKRKRGFHPLCSHMVFWFHPWRVQCISDEPNGSGFGYLQFRDGKMRFGQVKKYVQNQKSIGGKTRIRTQYDSATDLIMGPFNIEWYVDHKSMSMKSKSEHWKGREEEGKKEPGSFVMWLIHRTLELPISRYLTKGTVIVDLLSFSFQVQLNAQKFPLCSLPVNLCTFLPTRQPLLWYFFFSIACSRIYINRIIQYI